MSFVFVVLLAFVCLCSFGIGQGNNHAAEIATFVFFPSAIALYFAPSWIAGMRKHPKITAIFILNLLAGWTAIGWVVAIVWAYAAGADPYNDSRLSPPDAPLKPVKVCPFCAEEIHQDAIKCKYCGSSLPIGVRLVTEAE